MAKENSWSSALFSGRSSQSNVGRSVLYALLKGVLFPSNELAKDGSNMASVRNAEDLKTWSALLKSLVWTMHKQI